MKKAFLVSLVMLCASATVFAQDNDVKFSAGAELGFASGSFSNTHSIGIGGSAMLEIPLQDKLNWTAYAGILLYAGKSATGDTKFKGQTIIPLRVGVKYFLTEGIYGGLQAGLGLLSGFGSGAAFSYSPQIGYEFKTKGGKAVDATFKYDAYSKNGTIGAIGFRLAYIF
jgi:hypothetical protein